MSFLKEGQTIGKYSVESFIKDGRYGETYCVSDMTGVPYFLKLFFPISIPSNNIDSDGQIFEIVLSRKLSNQNVIQYVTDGVHEQFGKVYPYVVTQYFTGSLVAEPLRSGRIFPLNHALGIIKNALKGLVHMHSLGLIHNDITPRNIMFNPKQIESTQLIGLEHISEADIRGRTILCTDLTPFYHAPEIYRNKYDYRSDIYAIVAVLYAMMFGKAPWCFQLPEGISIFDEENAVIEAMKKPLPFSGSLDGCPSWLQQIFRICLQIDPDNRIQTAEDLLKAIELEVCPIAERVKNDGRNLFETSLSVDSDADNHETYCIKKKKGNGFADVAGMDDIKAILQQKVIFLLRNPEQTKKYKLTPPNGMLLYGPPGCGKTYFAEKFAEEALMNYIFIKGSDVGSTYIHGSQQKIAQLFKDAEKKAPTVICFDEFDAMVPKRSENETQSIINPEVNEFLSQINNCSQRGVFVIGTTNKKELIDEAILRKGRMDLHILIPPPDAETRKNLFELYLKDRPCTDVDTSVLSTLTENYSSSDIAYIVNDAALVAAYKNSPIEQKMLEESIRNNPSSLVSSNAVFPTSKKKIGF